MSKPAYIESSQQRADRLLAEHQKMRRAVRAISRLPIQIYRPRRLTRWQRLRADWLRGFNHPAVNAIGIVLAFAVGAEILAYVAMVATDPEPPLASDAYSVSMEATSRPAAAPSAAGQPGPRVHVHEAGEVR